MSFEAELEGFVRTCAGIDPAHDILHTRRVVENARRIAATEPSCNLRVVLAAAWLHDVIVPDRGAEIRGSSAIDAATIAGTFLRTSGLLPAEEIEPVQHAIGAHSSFSGISPGTLEARIVQDADRLDALGAIGVARCFVVGGRFGATLYHGEDMMGQRRDLDDRQFTLDHFQTRLFRLEETFHTRRGKAEAAERTRYMRAFVAQLLRDVAGERDGEIDGLSIA